MARHHLINGIQVPFTAQEEAEWDANEAAYAAKKAKEVKTEPKPYVAKRKLAYLKLGISWICFGILLMRTQN